MAQQHQGLRHTNVVMITANQWSCYLEISDIDGALNASITLSLRLFRSCGSYFSVTVTVPWSHLAKSITFASVWPVALPPGLVCVIFMLKLLSWGIELVKIQYCSYCCVGSAWLNGLEENGSLHATEWGWKDRWRGAKGNSEADKVWFRSVLTEFTNLFRAQQRTCFFLWAQPAGKSSESFKV